LSASELELPCVKERRTKSFVKTAQSRAPCSAVTRRFRRKVRQPEVLLRDDRQFGLQFGCCRPDPDRELRWHKLLYFLKYADVSTPPRIPSAVQARRRRVVRVGRRRDGDDGPDSVPDGAGDRCGAAPSPPRPDDVRDRDRRGRGRAARAQRPAAARGRSGVARRRARPA
jgi:hypothetical protein